MIPLLRAKPKSPPHRSESASLSRSAKLGVACLLVLALVMCANTNAQQSLVLTDVTIIDGTGKPAHHNRNVVIKGDRIQSIGAGHEHTLSSAKVIDLHGQTIMPLIINTHGHLGLTKGSTQSAANQTDENIRHQLLRYQEYGVGAARFRELTCTRPAWDLARRTACLQRQWDLQKCSVPRLRPKPAVKSRSKLPRSRTSSRYG
jgi:hypothetical protein